MVSLDSTWPTTRETATGRWFFNNIFVYVYYDQKAGIARGWFGKRYQKIVGD